MCEVNWRIEQPIQEQLDHMRETSFYKCNTPKTCIYCGCTFYYGQRQKIACGLCKLYIKCAFCGKEKYQKWTNFSGQALTKIRKAFEKHTSIKFYCSKSCDNMSRFEYGTCPNCGYEGVKIYNSRCPYCANKELNNQPIDCEIRGHFDTSFGGTCPGCNGSLPQNFLVETRDDLFKRMKLDYFETEKAITSSLSLLRNELDNYTEFIDKFSNKEFEEGIIRKVTLESLETRARNSYWLEEFVKDIYENLLDNLTDKQFAALDEIKKVCKELILKMEQNVARTQNLRVVLIRY